MGKSKPSSSPSLHTSTWTNVFLILKLVQDDAKEERAELCEGMPGVEAGVKPIGK